MVKYTSTQLECIKRENIPLHVPAWMDGAKVDLVHVDELSNPCNIPTWATTALWAPTINSSTEPMNRAIWGMLHLLIHEGYLEVEGDWGRDICKILNTLANGDWHYTATLTHVGAQFHGIRGRHNHDALMGILHATKRGDGAWLRYWQGAQGPRKIEDLPYPIAQWIGQFELEVDEQGKELGVVFHSELFRDEFLDSLRDDLGKLIPDGQLAPVHKILETILCNMLMGMIDIFNTMSESSVAFTRSERFDFDK